ncbi:hypothetical protein INS49_002778 [Diaporthe citri]|uniref:uncharacterized protein n=1 Tax=Diaporthe citri TaxID=83186 RepID=UPI001C7F14C7|nr:uncharacterized protein INS49_002778 [Diaporthe citri]KAG6368565.1 hypothetical protein INS49_002778 [Diaporthe citri]
MAFMGFPIEIREPILELALLVDTTEPPNDAINLTRELRKVPLEDDATTGKGGSTITAGEYTLLEKTSGWGGSASLPVFYRPGTCRDTALQLLLVSRQIHDETKRILDREADHSSWKADVMFIKYVGLWTTWLSASRFLSHVDTVHAQFRSFNTPETLDPAFFRDYLWRGGCGGPPVGVWGFYDLLMGFLEGIIGPFPRRREIDGPESHGDQQRNDARGITVGRLVLDFLSSTEENILPLNSNPPGFSQIISTRYLDPALPEQKLAALALARFCASHLGILMRPLLEDVDLSEGLFERVGEILIQVDGEPYEHFDLSEILVELSWRKEEQWEPGYYRLALVDGAFKWKEEVIERRRRAGSKVAGQLD